MATAQKRFWGDSLRAFRKRSGLNQAEFWGAIGMSQSGGSRMESRNSMPPPVEELIRLRHHLDIDTTLITKDNAARIRALLISA